MGNYNSLISESSYWLTVADCGRMITFIVLMGKNTAEK